MAFQDFGALGDLAEMFSIFAGYFYNWFSNLFTMSLYESLSVVLGGNIPEWDFLVNTSMGVFMFGSGLAVYVGYQLITWVINVLP